MSQASPGFYFSPMGREDEQRHRGIGRGSEYRRRGIAYSSTDLQALIGLKGAPQALGERRREDRVGCEVEDRNRGTELGRDHPPPWQRRCRGRRAV
jgi:hypothetical protein